MLLNEFKDKSNSLSRAILNNSDLFVKQSGRSQTLINNSNNANRELNNKFIIRKFDIFENIHNDSILGSRAMLKHSNKTVDYIDSSQNVFNRLNPSEISTPLLTLKEYISIILTFDPVTGICSFFYQHYPEIDLKDYSGIYKKQKINEIGGDDAIIRISKIIKSGKTDFYGLLKTLNENVVKTNTGFDEVSATILDLMTTAESKITKNNELINAIEKNKTISENILKISELQKEIQKLKAESIKAVAEIHPKLILNNRIQTYEINCKNEIERVNKELIASKYFPYLEDEGLLNVLEKLKKLVSKNNLNDSEIRLILDKIL